MAQEPDNLVLQMLRDIRATLAEHSRFHEEHRQAHEEHRRSFAELRAEMQQINQNEANEGGDESDVEDETE